MFICIQKEKKSAGEEILPTKKKKKSQKNKVKQEYTFSPMENEVDPTSVHRSKTGNTVQR